ncbi:hypothetical protein PBY51_001355 [Eleginops maclovinus]|uniref:Uncharacterized protein n=1 Tax=Eleginops maclovinus TaxID=56733 RepID=A0AAN7WVW7_ELEMC|nr:hypothetical protein PBY51_001355 [Eleginops maclovinus]
MSTSEQIFSPSAEHVNEVREHYRVSHHVTETTLNPPDALEGSLFQHERSGVISQSWSLFGVGVARPCLVCCRGDAETGSKRTREPG